MSKRLPFPIGSGLCGQCLRRSLRHLRAYSSKQVVEKSVRDETIELETDANRRIKELSASGKLSAYYPRLSQSPESELVSAARFSRLARENNKTPGTGEECDKKLTTVYGRVTAIRKHGTKLSFVMLYTPGHTSSRSKPTQAVLSLSRMIEHDANATPESFKQFLKIASRGDWIAVTGYGGTTNTGQWSIKATELPKILSPSLNVVPEHLEDIEVRMHNRYIDQIVNPSSLDVIFLRHKIISALRNFLNQQDFVEVSTPLLVAEAGGANARPFETYSTDLSGVKLNLRIAPELFLKRLVIGGMQKIFEIGPIFRNEGVDHSHNPEFTMCEFYATMTSLGDLMATTEALFCHLAKRTEQLRSEMQMSPLEIDFDEPFTQLEFIPSLEIKVRQRLPRWSFPDLSQSLSASQHLEAALEAFGITLPVPNSIPRLLDTLSSHLLESQCELPTFITHHPECMSPLSKSFEIEHRGIMHRVSARAELFIQGTEYVNCYEEENSPVEQRRKFEAQLQDDEGGDRNHRTLDENYLEALDWGLPPTGGWGAGVDRIVMLFAGKKRIADVLAFGTLRNVAALASSNVRKVQVDGS